jgi:hypothetical protein
MNHGRSKLLVSWFWGSTASTRGWCGSKACSDTDGGSGGDAIYGKSEDDEDDDDDEENEGGEDENDGDDGDGDIR